MTQQSLLDTMHMDATFSRNRAYRYDLVRQWDQSKPVCVFICLNPSTADEITNDPTVTRCINYARRWGCGAFVMCNLFAFRATEPSVMKQRIRPVSSSYNPARNDEVIAKWAYTADIVVCAWGNHGSHCGRGEKVYNLIANKCKPQCLGINQGGHPVHPLYQPKDAPLKPFYYE